MLAGYTPWSFPKGNPCSSRAIQYIYIDDDLAFPEYVTPHARDLLRRILVQDPSRRLDVIEVARHSWMYDFHPVVDYLMKSPLDI